MDKTHKELRGNGLTDVSPPAAGGIARPDHPWTDPVRAVRLSKVNPKSVCGLLPWSNHQCDRRTIDYRFAAVDPLSALKCALSRLQRQA